MGMVRRIGLVMMAFAPVVTGCAGNKKQIVMLPQQASTEPVQQGPGTPRVHIEGAKGEAIDGVELREVVGWELTPVNQQSPGGMVTGNRAATLGRRVCAPPCDIIVDGRRGQEFYLGGEGISESEHFTLNEDSGEVRIAVSPGSAGSRRAGYPLVGVGGAGVVIGGLILAARTADHSGDAGTQKVAVSMMAIGGALLGTGIALLVTGRTTMKILRPSPPITGAAPAP